MIFEDKSIGHGAWGKRYRNSTVHGNGDIIKAVLFISFMYTDTDGYIAGWATITLLQISKLNINVSC